MAKLTEPQCQILARMAEEPGEGGMLASWIAERCGHHYDTPWASSKLPVLVRNGFVEVLERGWYRITPAGRAALASSGDGT